MLYYKSIIVLVYLFIGFTASILSALPLGASNIAVINTTLKQNAKQAFKIAITAGIVEVLLSYYALDCNQTIKAIFDNNLWVQLLIVAILFLAGFLLLFKKQSEVKPKKRKFT